jgi:methyl-accepting chemotaxis protein
MKISIKTKLVAGLMVTMAPPVLAIFLVMAWTTSQQSHENFVRSTAKELQHISGTIQTFLDESRLNSTIITSDPLLQRIGPSLTSYLDTTSDNTTQTRPDDLLGQDIVSLLRRIQDSHPNYVDVFLGTRYGGFLIANSISLPAGYDPRIRPWYKQALQNPGQPGVTEAYASTTGEAVISVVRSFKGPDGQPLGVAGMDISLKGLTDMIKEIRIGETGFMVLVEDNGTILVDPLNPENNFKSIDEASEPALAELFAMESGNMDVTINGTDYVGVVSTSKESGWKSFGLITRAEIMAPVYSALWKLVVVMLVAPFFLLAILGIFTNRTMVRPLQRVSGFLREIGEGDFSRRINEQRNDEIGQIFLALDNMADSLQAKAELAEGIAGGDLTRNVKLTSQRDSLGSALRTMTQNLNQIIAQVNTASVQIDAGSDQVSGSSQALSQGATEQAASLEEITSSMTQISSQTKANAENASLANRMMGQAKDTVTGGQQAGREMGQAMQEIAESSSKVSKIIKVIDEIAFQTNLLALNAAVEAARAGRHGKGFAVVAEEVRNLASRSAKAAQETTELIETALSRVEAGQELTGRLDESFEDIATSSAKVADLVAEIAAASNEQAEGVSQINTALGQVDQVTQQNTANAEETASAAEELSAQAAQLRSVLRKFRLRKKGPSSAQDESAEPKRRYTARSAPPQPLPASRQEEKKPPRGQAPKAQSQSRQSARQSARQVKNVEHGGRADPDDAWGTSPQQAKPATPQAAKPTKPAPRTQDEQRPEDIISLDDNDFGRY